MFIREGKSKINVLFLFKCFPLCDQDLVSHFSWSLCNFFNIIQVSPKALIHLIVQFILILCICAKFLNISLCAYLSVFLFPSLHVNFYILWNKCDLKIILVVEINMRYTGSVLSAKIKQFSKHIS